MTKPRNKKPTRRKCLSCGAKFTPYGWQTFCSRQCYLKKINEDGRARTLKRQENRSPRACPVCNRFFKSKNPKKKYCSKPCDDFNAKLRQRVSRSENPERHLEIKRAWLIANPKSRASSRMRAERKRKRDLAKRRAAGRLCRECMKRFKPKGIESICSDNCRRERANRRARLDPGAKARRRKHYLANTDKYAEKAKKWRQANLESCRVRAHAYYAKNKEKMAAAAKAHFLKNPAQVRARKRAWYLKNRNDQLAKARARLKDPELRKLRKLKQRLDYHKHRDERREKAAERYKNRSKEQKQQQAEKATARNRHIRAVYRAVKELNLIPMET